MTPSDEQVERGATALHDLDVENDHAFFSCEYADEYREQARAVLEAIAAPEENKSVIHAAALPIIRDGITAELYEYANSLALSAATIDGVRLAAAFVRDGA